MSATDAGAVTAWLCTVCGYVHQGPEPPDVCPVCGADKALFEPYQQAEPAAVKTAEQSRCLNCKYVHDGPAPPAFCPVCGATYDRFEPYLREAAAGPHADLRDKIVIVGAGIAGVSAAEAAAGLSPRAEIVLISKESHLPYYRLNLTRYLAGEVEAAELELHPRNWYEERNIDLLLETELLAIDPEGKELDLSGGETLGYDKLILTVGSHPFVPSLPGVNREKVTVLRTREHAEEILETCKEGSRCVCIGGGLLGLETAGALSRRGAEVTLLEGHGWLLPRQLNRRAGERLEAFVAGSGIKLLRGVRVEELVGDEQVRGLLLDDGETIPADMVIITTGVRSNSYLARLADIKVNRGVIVDSNLTASRPDIFAAGDVAEFQGVTYGLWGPSQFQGTIAGMNAVGERAEFAGIPRSNMLKVLGYDLFSIGQVMVEDASSLVVEDELDDNYFYFVFQDSFLVGSILLGDTALSAAVKNVVEKRADCSSLLGKRPRVKDVLDFLEGAESE
jgi:nitrite reductase (NADH) large subunit